jgi:DNA invertase Pin-like site-specific DNA recombinase
MRAYAYVRVSGSGQVNKGGFDRQLKAISKYSKENSIELVDTFQEEGTSGTLENRPALARLLVSLELNHHGISTVIIEKLDRLARDLMVQEAIIRDFKSKGFKLISAAEGPDLLADDPSRKLIRQVFGSIAEYEKSMLVQKLKASRERIKVITGKCEGRKGYHDTEEGQAIVKRIHVLRRKQKHYKRRTWQQVADILNSEGIRTMEGRNWTLYRVQQTAKES